MIMGNYDDIINHPHHVSKNHPQMPLEARAAQFAPFAALTGYGAAIDETARQTDQQVELDEYDNEQLNRKYILLKERIGSHPMITVVYFKPDTLKAGGFYQSMTAVLKQIDEVEHQLVMADGERIPLSRIIEIELTENVSL